MYGFFTTLNCDFDTAVEKTTAELQKEGFGVLTTIDVAGTLKKKLDVDRPRYTILGACNPVLANQAITAEPDIGLLLPCNVLVREEADGKMSVGFMDPATVLTLVDKPEVGDLAAQVREKLMRVKDALAA